MRVLALILGAIAVRVLVPRLRQRPNDPVARTLVHSFGVTPTGSNGVWLRRDRLRAAGINAATSAGCIAVALGTFFGLADQFQNRSRTNLFLSFVGILFFFFGGLAFLSAIGALLRAPFAPRAVPDSATSTDSRRVDA